MSQFTRTWWGNKFIDALERFTDSGRLGRGRSYARNDKVKSFKINDGLVMAEVRGSVNPYFGVYKEPLYKTKIEFEPISQAKWKVAIAQMASKASFISRLLLNEMPDNIENAFSPLGLHLLPSSREDFKTTCSCPDYSNPCKHIAGVYYLVAAELDKDPFLLFELRGLSKEVLHRELAKTPLGMALSAELTADAAAPVAVDSYYTQAIASEAQTVSLKEFWHGAKRLPQTIEVAPPSVVSAIVVKKQGDFPQFWHKDGSFIEAMEELYLRVKKNK
ncbi:MULTISPECIES: SWIM zinc finger family protein [unclassified Microcoleus]|uniref:SWIM zinc finger family protein n=1 Tax=unclassified Microcoleus TaxID=2642155 RepID=UPI002FCF46CD